MCFEIELFGKFCKRIKCNNVVVKLTSGLKKNELFTTNFVYCMGTKNKLQKESTWFTNDVCCCL